MSEHSTLSIRNQVIAGLILAAILALLSFVLGWWPVIWGFVTDLISYVWSFFFIDINLPVWAIIPLAIIVLFAGLIIIAHIVSHMRANSQSLPFLKYIEDDIHDIKWRWEWELRGGKYRVKDLCSFCPTCDCQLIYQDVSRFGMHGLNSCNLICEHCDHSVKAKFDNGDYEYARSQIDREISRRARKMVDK